MHNLVFNEHYLLLIGILCIIFTWERYFSVKIPVHMYFWHLAIFLMHTYLPYLTNIVVTRRALTKVVENLNDWNWFYLCNILIFNKFRWKVELLTWYLNSSSRILDTLFSNLLKKHNWEYILTFWKNHNRVGNVCKGWPGYGVKCLCSRGRKWEREGSHFH